MRYFWRTPGFYGILDRGLIQETSCWDSRRGRLPSHSLQPFFTVCLASSSLPAPEPIAAPPSHIPTGSFGEHRQMPRKTN
jgi:hypothetical protein